MLNRKNKVLDVEIHLGGILYTVYVTKENNDFDHEFGTESRPATYDLQYVKIGEYDVTEALNERVLDSLSELASEELGGN